MTRENVGIVTDAAQMEGEWTTDQVAELDEMVVMI